MGSTGRTEAVRGVPASTAGTGGSASGSTADECRSEKPLQPALETGNLRIGDGPRSAVP